MTAPTTTSPAAKAGDAPERRSTAKPKMHWLAKLRRDWPLVLMAAPMMLLVWGFWWIPSLGNVIAFQDYKPYGGGIFDSRLVGFTHFQMLFSDPEFTRALVNTLSITVFQLVFYFPVPIALALLMHSLASERLRGRCCRAWCTCRTSSPGCS